MKKSYIITGITALTILAAAAGVTSTALAAGKNGGFGNMLGKFRGQIAKNLTDAQKTEIKTKADTVKAALEAGDYNAWVTAEKAVNENSPQLKKITAANFSDYVAKYKAQEAKMAEQKTKQDAVKAALDASDYTAWVNAMKSVNANSPLLQKITADNFSRYVEANKLRTQADTIMTELGLNDGKQGGFGFGGGHGRGMQK